MVIGAVGTSSRPSGETQTHTTETRMGRSSSLPAYSCCRTIDGFCEGGVGWQKRLRPYPWLQTKRSGGSCALEDSLRNRGHLQKMVMLLPAIFLSGARILHCQGAEVEQFTLRQKDAPG
jgi:hypothetical protein